MAIRCITWLSGLAAMLLMVLPGFVFQATAATADIRGVRLWRAPDNTRLVFDLSGPVRHSVFTLSAPNRIVIDVTGATLKTGLDRLPIKETPITGMRAAQRDPQSLRLVIDLSAEVVPKSFTLVPNQEYGHRLVVDLFDKGADAIAELASRPSLPPRPVPSPNTIAVAPQAQRPSLPPSANLPVAPNVSLNRRLPASTGQRDIVIAVDAGHGGEDPGALGPAGEREKDVTLAIARRLHAAINAERGYRAELVRSGDYFIPLRQRTEIARKKGADLFVSIHADAAPRSSALGASVYALSDRGATSETARWLADTENRSDLIGGVGNLNLDNKDRMLAGVLLDLSMTATLSSSLKVGQRVLSHLGNITSLHKPRVEQAGFLVLKSPDIPSILVETGFISNPDEAQKLQSPGHQQALVRSIHSGIRQFFQESPPPGTYIAWLRDSGKSAQHLPSSPPLVPLVDFSKPSQAQRPQRYLLSLRDQEPRAWAE